MRQNFVYIFMPAALATTLGLMGWYGWLVWLLANPD